MASSGYSVNNFLKEATIKSSQIAPKKHEKKSGLTGLFRIAIIIAEVGLAIVAPETIPIQIGIGLAAAGANTALSASAGDLTAAGVAIDFGAAFIPALQGASFARRIGKGMVSEIAQKGEKAALDATAARMTKAAEKRWAGQLNYAWKNSAKWEREALAKRREAVEMAKELAYMSSVGAVTPEQQALKEVIIRSVETDANVIASREARIIEEACKKFAANPLRVERKLDQMRRSFDELHKLPFVKRMTSSSFMQSAEKILGKNKAKLLEEVYFKAAKSQRAIVSGFKTATAMSRSRAKLAQTFEQLTEDGRGRFAMFLRRLQNIEVRSSNQMEKEFTSFIGTMSDVDQKTIHRLVEHDDLLLSLNVYSKKADESAIRRWVKYAGTTSGKKSFNERWVQKLQMIDPNDLGRYLPERAYQYLKEKIIDKYKNDAVRKASKSATKGIRSSKSMDEAFFEAGGRMVGKAKAGGIMIPSRYILGMKVLPGGTPLQRWVLIKFNKENTSSKKGNNVGGKRDLIITATDKDIYRLETEGTSYWFAVGQRKGWFVSRGGKRVAGRNAGMLSNELSLFLGFVPIPALRNVLSIVSNYVENINALSKGTYFKTYLPKLESAIVRTTINRSARLLTRAVIGGKILSTAQKGLQEAQQTGMSDLIKSATRKVNAAKWIGRELQRTAGSALTVFEARDKAGYFTFTDGSSPKSGRSGLANFGRRMYMTSIPTSIKSTAVRTARRHGGMSGIELIGAKRNLSQVGRIYGAVTPSGVKPLRSLTRIR